MKKPTTYYLLFLTAIAICMAVLSSCTPQKRITRICNNHPQLCSNDTNNIIRTYPRLSSVVFFNDTIRYITAGNDSLEFIRYGDSIIINEITAPDTVIQYITAINRDPKDIQSIDSLSKELSKTKRKLKVLEAKMKLKSRFNLLRIAFILFGIFLLIIGVAIVVRGIKKMIP